MVRFATNVSGAILLPSSIQITESISGSVVPLAMFFVSSRSMLVDFKLDNCFLFLVVAQWQAGPCGIPGYTIR